MAKSDTPSLQDGTSSPVVLLEPSSLRPSRRATDYILTKSKKGENPDRIDPDRWPLACHNQRLKRRVRSSGTVSVDKHNYYIGRALKGRYVGLRVDAHNRQFEVELDHEPIKTLLIKSLYNQELDFADYVELIREEAISERRLARRRVRYAPL